MINNQIMGSTKKFSISNLTRLLQKQQKVTSKAPSVVSKASIAKQKGQVVRGPGDAKIKLGE